MAKTLQRILRFSRFVASVDAGDGDLAEMAAAAGYRQTRRTSPENAPGSPA